jgi:diguanylate cyclase (GGDEF)-like protein
LLLINARRLDRIEAARHEEAERNEAQMRFQASHDALTGLHNRHEFERGAERLIEATQQDQGEHALCFMDLDQFKVVNDTCGHIAGDELLRQLSVVLQDAVRASDTLARLGGDEFGILMEQCSLRQAHRTATQIQRNIQDFQFSWEGETFQIGVSIGLVAIDETTASVTELLKHADAACYIAKDMGRNQIQVYNPDDTILERRHGEMQWVARINQALEKNRFTLYAQAIEPLGKSADMHYELLLRMIEEDGEIIPPAKFLPAAERYDLMHKLDVWVVEEALSLMTSNPAFIDDVNFISINLSGQSLTHTKFLNSVITRIEALDFAPEKICFEITETAAISNLRAATEFINRLKNLGCHFALDDFGSGLSSFGYLKNLPVDYLKIDGVFVKDVAEDPIDHAMVKSINDIGHVMGMKTIAEFVETDAIRTMLQALRVDYAQGYDIGKPMPFEDVLELQETRNRLDLASGD